jgi:hypothetical protein
MAYADELLALAQDIANLYPQHPHQPSLRRAVSTAYYALFHLLISEATSNWSHPELRPALGRVFDHGPMKQAADKKVLELNTYFKEKPPEGPQRTVSFHLHKVADTFAQAQYHRNEADYNTARDWELTEVLLHIDGIAEAFKVGTSSEKNQPRRLTSSPCSQARNAGRVSDHLVKGDRH